MINRVLGWIRRSKTEDCDDAQDNRKVKDAEVNATKEKIRKKLHEQAQRLHYLEVATDVERIRAKKQETS
jgi:hypothetical protein